MKVFKEEQRFRQLWVIILIGISALMPLGIILGTYIKDKSSFSIVELLSVVSVIIVASALIFLFKLSTRIDEKGIHYKFFPFHFKLKCIKWDEIDKAYVRKYDAITEYGGWGLKGGALWKKSKGTAINVSGDIGIQLELKNGKKLLIGTKQEDHAQQILQTYTSKINTTNNENYE